MMVQEVLQHEKTASSLLPPDSREALLLLILIRMVKQTLPLFQVLHPELIHFLFSTILGGGTVGIQEQEIEEIPTSFSLAQNFPNPFNPITTIQFSLPQAGDVTLKIYNVLGEEVKTLVNEYKEIGNHSVQFNANNLASGMYLYRFQAGSFVETKKMILLK